MGMAHSILKVVSMPNWFRKEVVTMAMFILNRSPTYSVKGEPLMRYGMG
jgi:hypothetical protein